MENVTINPILDNKSNTDYVIENGTLIEYRRPQDLKIVIPDGVTSIAESAIGVLCMKCCLSLSIPKSVSYIHHKFMTTMSGFVSIEVDPNNKFYDGNGECLVEKATKRLIAGTSKSIIPSDGSVTVIGKGAFSNCEFTKITIPNDIISIEDKAFSFCENLEEIVLPEGLTNIGFGVFAGCKKLKKIILPSTISKIAEGAFMSWGGNITISNNKDYLVRDNCLIDVKNKTLIAGCGKCVIPADESVTAIGEYAFYGNRNLVNVVIPDSITYVGKAAFGSCKKLISIVSPDSITYIGDYVLTYCDDLEKVVFGQNLKYIGKNAFWVIIRNWNRPRRKLKEVIFKNPKSWTVNKIMEGNAELISERIPEEILINPFTAAAYIFDQTQKQTSNCLGVAFNRI